MNAAAELYLDIMKGALTRALFTTGIERHTVRPRGPKSRLIAVLNAVISRFDVEIVRLYRSTADDYLESGHEATNRAEDAESMLGRRQFDNMHRCVQDVLRHSVAGDFLEAGVWRGGMTIFMRAALAAYGVRDRKVWVADSFAGLPQVDELVEHFSWSKGDMAISLETVQKNFQRYGLLDEQVEFLKGYFSDTLPRAPVRKLAILRIDADLYRSTLDALENLYDKLSPGGYAIFDDYYNLPDCRRAIDEFRARRGITEEMCRIDTRAIFWRKGG